ncbi:MAG TPA: NAD(P)H-binding protein [Candidatus Micrarchaeaceae archaeon]|nr:NAD(P)H-binding protein [Candidatus Micrarchaeaceae archaeon]
MILITGATGRNGSELVRRLSAKGIQSRALVRNRANAQPLALLPNVEIVDGDMARPDSLTEALRGVDRAMLISSSDPTMVETQSSFVEVARKASVKPVVKLSAATGKTIR